ncbi:MAG TPA: sugar ABC transporter substrate-binding protein [Brevibacterium sp.]|nr:sugar ABC transporter substrate-binding protein [Brevibacterium sp.]
MRSRRFTRPAVAATAIATLALAACSGGGDGDNEGGGGGGSGPTTLTFAASTFGDPGRGPGLEAWLEEFNESQDDVIVEPAVVPFPTFGQTVLTQMGAGEGPDLVRFDMPEFASAADAGLLEPLDELVDVGQFELHETPDQFMFANDTRYGVIFEASNYALYHNTDLVPEPPTTFEEFLEAAEENTGGEIYGMAFRHTAQEENGMWQDIFNYVVGWGGAFSDGSQLTLNSPEVVEGLEAYQAVYDADVIPKGTDAATFRAMFNEGKVAMEIDNGGFVAAVRGANAELPFSVAPTPFPVRAQSAILAPITVNAASDDTEAAATFLEWMLQPENQKSLQLVLGSSSVATVTERTPEELEESPFLAEVDALTETSVPQVVLGFEARTPEIRSIVIEEVLRAISGEVDMQTAMDSAQERASSLVG